MSSAQSPTKKLGALSVSDSESLGSKLKLQRLPKLRELDSKPSAWNGNNSETVYGIFQTKFYLIDSDFILDPYASSHPAQDSFSEKYRYSVRGIIRDALAKNDGFKRSYEDLLHNLDTVLREIDYSNYSFEGDASFLIDAGAKLSSLRRFGVKKKALSRPIGRRKKKTAPGTECHELSSTASTGASDINNENSSFSLGAVGNEGHSDSNMEVIGLGRFFNFVIALERIVKERLCVKDLNAKYFFRTFADFVQAVFMEGNPANDVFIYDLIQQNCMTFYSPVDNHQLLVQSDSDLIIQQDDGQSPAKTVAVIQVKAKEADLNDLKARLEKTRFAESLENGDFHYGFQTPYLKEVVKYWKDEYDWRKQEAILNSFPHFKTQIQGIDIHYIHAKPKGNVKGKPLLIVHGWPGSVWEFYKILPMLTDPVSHGGQAEDAFEVIAPSIPGYGFSEAPHKKGFGHADTARIFRELMLRLGFQEFYLQGGDWGAIVSTMLAANYPKNVLGVHLNMYSASMADGMASLHQMLGALIPSIFYDKLDAQIVSMNPPLLNLLEESGYFHLQATKPDTSGVGLNDSPAGLAAYIIEKFSTWTNREWRDLPDGGLTKKYTLDELLTNVMIYWLNGNIVSSQRYYKEFFHNEENQELDKLPVTVPSGLACLPNELMLVPRAIASYRFKNIVQFTLMPRGGHFAVFEEPGLMAEDIRSFVRKVNSPSKRT